MKFIPPSHWQANFYEKSFLFNPIVPLANTFADYPQWPLVKEYQQAQSRNIINANQRQITFTDSTTFTTPPRYESIIYETGKVPTRPANWHDFFNALVWMSFPLSKAAINRQHYLAQQQHPGKKQRSPTENFLTLFDENGVIVLCSDPHLKHLLNTQQWLALFWENREAVQQAMRFIIFGHSIYEKALRPYLGMTGSGIIFSVEKSELLQTIVFVDQLVATFLNKNVLPTRFTPIPILGVPGWWPANESKSFYENTAYFRAKRG